MNKHLSLLLLISSAIFLSLSCGTKPSGTQGSSVPTDNARFEQDILYNINAHRKTKGLSPLILNKVITSEAVKHSERMASGRTPLGHSGFSSRIQSISNQLGGPITRSAENVAYGSRSAKEVVSNWLNSPGHRQNIEGEFNLTGIGVASNKRGELYFTQIFIRK